MKQGAEAGRTLAQRQYVAFRQYFNWASLFLAPLRKRITPKACKLC